MLTSGAAFEHFLLAAAVLLLAGALSSKASSKLGIPIPLLFIFLGMAAGSEGPGGIYFDDARIARDLGTVALVVILFSGGLDTDWKGIRPVLGQGLTLATLGVAATAGLAGAFAHFVLGFGWLESLLLGAILSSTDAAAVFAVLKARGIRLRRGLGPLLELESGSNDPMAVFLTFGLTGIIIGQTQNAWSLAPSFFIEMGLGALAGWGLGRGALFLINRLRLEYEGLYSSVTLGLAFLSYAGTEMIGGNGFLAVYLTGLTLGNSIFVHRSSLRRFHDGTAWLMQIVMFVTLGLLSFPSQVAAAAGGGLAMAGFLVLAARPLAVGLSLLPFRFSWRERLFVGWVGLRGAVPIILATIPLTAGVQKADEMFNLVFFAVLVSVAVQGTTIGWAAKLLGVEAPVPARPSEPSARQAQTLEVEVAPGSFAAGRRVVELGLPSTALILLLTRKGRSSQPQGSTVIEPGDKVLLASRKDDVEELRTLFAQKPAR